MIPNAESVRRIDDAINVVHEHGTVDRRLTDFLGVGAAAADVGVAAITKLPHFTDHPQENRIRTTIYAEPKVCGLYETPLAKFILESAALRSVQPGRRSYLYR
jgi:hypothetical protein